MSVERSAFGVGRSGATAAVDPDNPWPGLASFTEETHTLFFGRDKETDELSRLVRRETLTVLFGQSGLGKSSLLQAGLFPLLRENDHLPLYLRLDHSTRVVAGLAEAGPGSAIPATTPPLADQVKAALNAAIATAKADAPLLGATETLWEYFHRKDVDIWSAKNRLLTPVLAFDQFEEIFTLGRADETRRERSRAFLAELADLVENRPPAALREKFDRGEADPTRYNFDKPSCRVILSLREDFLPDLEGLKQSLPALIHNRLRLKRLNGAQALEAVTKPAPHLLAEGVGEKIVEFVAGARGGSAERLLEMEVEPALLSVICRELNERRRTLGQAQITADLVSGNRREILTDFYERSVADLPEAMRTFVEDHLLTKSGYRDNLALETALEFPGVTRPLIDTLVARRLLRIEDRLGVQRVELTHDVLAEVIRSSRDAHHQRIAIEEAREREHRAQRRLWLARSVAVIAFALLAGVSWIAWRAVRAEREQARLRIEAEALRTREAALRQQAEADELAAKRRAYAADMNVAQQALARDNLGRAQQLLDRHRPAAGQPDLRGWEWRYLWQLCQNEAETIIARKSSPIRAIAVSPDGRWLASGGTRELALFALPDKTEKILPAEGLVTAIGFSPAEPLLVYATTSTDGNRSRVLLWDLAAGRSRNEFNVEGRCTGVAFAPDGKKLFACGSGGSGAIVTWSITAGKILATFPAAVTQSNPGNAFATNREATLAAYGTRDGNLHVIDLATGEKKWTARATDEFVISLAFSPDGKVLASGAGFADATIKLWSVETGQVLGRLEGHRAHVDGLGFSADGKMLASASADQTLRVWDVENRRSLRTLHGHTLEVWSLALDPQRMKLWSGSKSGEVFGWEMTGASDQRTFVIVRGAFGVWRFSGDGSIVALDFKGRLVRLRGKQYEQEEELVRLDEGTSVALAKDRPLMAVGNNKGLVRIWDYDRRELVQQIRSGEGALSANGFLAKGTQLVTEGADNFVRVWDLATAREISAWQPPHGVGGTAVLFSPDERTCAMLHPAGGAVRDLVKNELRVLPQETALTRGTSLGGAAYSADGKFILLSYTIGYAQVVDATTFREVARLGGFIFGVHSTVFSPDARRIATGSTSFEAMRVWDASNYEPLITLEGVGSGLYTAAFSPDSNVLGSTNFNGVLQLWRAPSWAEIAAAERDRAAKSAR